MTCSNQSSVIMICILLASGCSEQATTAVANTGAGAKVRAESVAARNSTKDKIVGESSAVAGPSERLNDNDRYWLRSAANACNRQDFKDFFVAFVRSAGVRHEYTADPVLVVTRGTDKKYPRDRYFGFPIGMTDYRFVSKNSEGDTTASELLWLDFKPPQNGSYRIDWVRVRYSGLGNDAEGEAEIEGTYGLPGYLLFKASKGCWLLSEDTLYEGPFEGELTN